MLMSYLKFIDEVRVSKGRPDVWLMVLLDGVSTHVTVEILEFFTTRKLL